MRMRTLCLIITVFCQTAVANPFAPEYATHINYSAFDLIVPNKFGATVHFIKSETEFWELEYLRGSLSFALVVDDLGKMTDQRLSFSRREYFNPNFYVVYGITYFDFSAKLGATLLNSVGANIPSVDVIEVQSVGGQAAIGHQWVFHNQLSIGIEWIGWAQPMIQLRKEAPFLKHSSSEWAKETVRKALNVASYFPHFSVLKIQLGYFF